MRVEHLTLRIIGVTFLALAAYNTLLGWWWADPVAALVMVPIIVREGLEGLRGHQRADCATSLQ